MCRQRKAIISSRISRLAPLLAGRTDTQFLNSLYGNGPAYRVALTRVSLPQVAPTSTPKKRSAMPPLSRFINNGIIISRQREAMHPDDYEDSASKKRCRGQKPYNKTRRRQRKNLGRMSAMIAGLS